MSVSWTEDLLVVEIPDRGVPTVDVVSSPLQVEIAPTGLQGARGPGVPIVFGRKGVVVLTAESLPYFFTFDTTLTSYSVALTQSPVGSDITVEALINGVVAFTITVPDGSTVVSMAPINVDVVVGDLLSVRITGVGSTSPGENMSIFITD